VSTVAIDFDKIAWRNARGEEVNLKMTSEGIIELPWKRAPLTGDRRSLKDWIRMASGKSQYYISKLLNQMFNATSYSFPGTLYFALWTSTLSASSTGSTSGETAYTSYARVGVANNTTNYSTSASGSSTTNSTAITFAANTGSASTITYVMIVDASSTGNMIYFGSITSTTINAGDTPQMNSSALTVSEA
jgi:hypothetical protein